MPVGGKGRKPLEGGVGLGEVIAEPGVVVSGDGEGRGGGGEAILLIIQEEAAGEGAAGPRHGGGNFFGGSANEGGMEAGEGSAVGVCNGRVNVGGGESNVWWEGARATCVARAARVCARKGSRTASERPWSWPSCLAELAEVLRKESRVSVRMAAPLVSGAQERWLAPQRNRVWRVGWLGSMC